MTIEAEIGVLRPQAQEGWQSQKLEEARNRPSLWSLGVQSCPHRDLGPLVLILEF